MREQHDQRIADAADLLADVRQHLLFDIGVAGLSKVDIDDAELASDRAEKGRSRADRLNDISGKRHFECRHAQFPLLPSRIAPRAKIKASFRFD